MQLLSKLSGFKTYIAASGLIGLGLYQLTVGQYATALQSFLTGLTAVGLRHAIAKQAV
jgi:hypothetical protein